MDGPETSDLLRDLVHHLLSSRFSATPSIADLHTSLRFAHHLLSSHLLSPSLSPDESSASAAITLHIALSPSPSYTHGSPRTVLKKIMILSVDHNVIVQVDYSGTRSYKALHDKSYEVIFLNSKALAVVSPSATPLQPPQAILSAAEY